MLDLDGLQGLDLFSSSVDHTSMHLYLRCALSSYRLYDISLIG